MRFIFACILACLTMGGTLGTALAWGPTGHRITGDIAERFLTDDSKAAIEAILGVEGLAEASTWADFMRSAPNPFWQRQASHFHFVTVPDGRSYADTGKPDRGDAVTALNSFSMTLLDPKASLEDKQLALRFAVHLVGDLHQPLHVGNGTDRGGNLVTVVFFDEVTNLHRVWDESMIRNERLSYSEYADWLAARITPERAREWMTADADVWIQESAELRPGVYPDSPKLSYDYVFEHKATMEQRLAMGGVRIAAFLNAIFAK